jgi:hypothetical protein
VRIGCAAALVLVLGSQARAGAAEPTNLRGAPSAADRQAYAQYQRQLQQLLAAERPNAATGLSTTSCKLFQAAPERVPAQECMTCHGMHTTHPVELDYEAARFSSSALRPGAEVIRRGVFLPDGKVQCVSCHDAASRWAYHLAIPPGALVRPAVNPRDPSTYERPVALSPPQALPAGTSVSPTPLCKACHSIGE